MSFKGQNAIEYLSTYGWMLVVVAIAGGIFYTNYVPEEQCRDEVTLDMSNQLQIADVGTGTDGDLALLVRNWGAESATVQEITATSEGNTTTLNTNKTIESTEEGVFRLTGTQSTTSCHTVELEFTFNSSDLGLVSDNATLEGRFTVE